MSQIGKITLLSLGVIALFFVLSTAMAQESTEAEMSDDMAADTAAEEEVIELEEQVVIGSRARPVLSLIQRCRLTPLAVMSLSTKGEVICQTS